MVKCKTTTFKQRLIRLLDSWSYRLRRYANKSKGISSRGISTIDKDFNPVSVSFVTHCPYCGSKNWDTPMAKPDGTLCHHPTKLRLVK